jgi:hypothetical protein
VCVHQGPRDLTLASRGGTITGGTAGGTRTRRVFKPNIPPRRGEQPAAAASSTSTADSSSKSGSTSVDKTQNPGGGRGRGRGRGGPRGRREFIQSESVFSEGVGDPNAAARKSGVPSMRNASAGFGNRRGGGGGGGGGGAGGRSTSNITPASLKDLIKVEEKPLLSDKRVFGDDVEQHPLLEDDDEEEIDDPQVPIMLPLTSCKIIIV